MSRHWVERIGWVVLVWWSTSYWNDSYNAVQSDLFMLQKKHEELKQSYDELYKGSEKEAEDMRHKGWKRLAPPD